MIRIRRWKSLLVLMVITILIPVVTMVASNSVQARMRAEDYTIKNRHDSKIGTEANRDTADYCLQISDVLLKLSEIEGKSSEEIEKLIIEKSSCNVRNRRNNFSKVDTDTLSFDFSNLSLEVTAPNAGYKVTMSAPDIGIGKDSTMDFCIYIIDDYLHVNFKNSKLPEIKSIEESFYLECSDEIIPDKAGYEFEGWYEDEACTKPFLIPDDSSKQKQLVNEDITLYPNWLPIATTSLPTSGASNPGKPATGSGGSSSHKPTSSGANTSSTASGVSSMLGSQSTETGYNAIEENTAKIEGGTNVALGPANPYDNNYGENRPKGPEVIKISGDGEPKETITSVADVNNEAMAANSKDSDKVTFQETAIAVTSICSLSAASIALVIAITSDAKVLKWYQDKKNGKKE